MNLSDVSNYSMKNIAIPRCRDYGRAVESLLGSASARRLRADACLLIAFYFSTADVLTAEARQRAITHALDRNAAWEDWKRWSFQDSFVTVRFEPFWEAVDRRLRELNAAREAVVTDPEILGGTPVLRGTRVPVHDVAAALARGADKKQVLAMYPALTSKQLDLARVYAKAAPQRGRPRRVMPPQGARVISAKKRLRAS